MADKRQDMLQFWSEHVGRYGADPRSNTNDIWLREVEIAAVEQVIEQCRPRRVLDFGCANGFTTRRLAEVYPGIVFLGVDINADMIAAASCALLPQNLSFRCGSVLADDLGGAFDFILAIRVFQNIESPAMQVRVFDRLHELLAPGGWFYFIETYADGYEQINRDRASLGLPTLPIHPHLTLLTESFDQHVAGVMETVERGSPSSAYYLITRLVYSKLASMNNESIDYDHPLHRLAAAVPQIGEYGPQKCGLYRKRIGS